MYRADGCAEEYKRIRALIMGPGGKGKGFMQQMSKQMGNSRGAMNPHNMQMNIQQMSRMLPPQACSHLPHHHICDQAAFILQGQGCKLSLRVR